MGYILCTHCKYVDLYQCMKIKSSGQKVFDIISICYVQEKNPFIFFSQIYLFQTFCSHIYSKNVQFFYMPIQMEFKLKYFNCLILLRF
jgi:hypothetical protein